MAFVFQSVWVRLAVFDNACCVSSLHSVEVSGLWNSCFQGGSSNGWMIFACRDTLLIVLISPLTGRIGMLGGLCELPPTFCCQKMGGSSVGRAAIPPLTGCF